METAIGFSLVFVAGALTAYMDIVHYFEKKSVSVLVPFLDPSALTFLIGNGLVGAAILWWAVADPTGAINDVLRFESPIGKGLVIGLTVPALMRSRWFRVSDESAPAGLDALYQSIRKSVLHRVNQNAIRIKERIKRDYAKRFQGRVNLPDALRETVLADRKPFVEESVLEDIEREFLQIQKFYEADAGSEKHLREVIRWAMDHSGIRFVQRCLSEIDASPETAAGGG